jgi:beta-glucanase (GH16 family)
MRKLILFLSILSACSTSCFGQLPSADPSYQVVFGDDFNDTTGYMGCNIDTSKWITRTPWNLGSTQNTVIYSWVPTHDTVTYDVAGYNFDLRDTSNVHVVPSSGVCRLTARRGPFVSYTWSYPNGGFLATLDTFKYSNGSLTARRKFRFGYFEIRFRLPSNIPPSLDNNYLPTCWLFDAHDSLNPPVHSEIDIYEIDGRDNNFTNSIYFTNELPNEHKDHVEHIATVTGGVWHTAAVDWTREHIDFYYDGTFIRRDIGYADSLAPMQAFIEAYVPNLWSMRNVNSNTVFPYVYEIDYYKVYQRKEVCDTSKVYANATAISFNSKLYKDLTLKTNCSFNNGTATAIATDWVLIDAGTTIDSNMNMYVDVVPCNNPTITSALSIIPSPVESTFRKSRTKQP